MTKKALITGHAGFIGRHLADTLRFCGVRVQECTVDMLKESLADQGYQKQDYIFHLAAKSPAATDAVDTTQIMRENVKMAKNVLEFALAVGAKVIVASSSHVYPPIIGENAHPLVESEMVYGKTMSAFGLSKQETEKVCREFSQKHGVPAVLVRLSNVYGPGDCTNRFVPTFVYKCLHKQFPLEVLGSGETKRDFIYVDDAVNGLVLASLISELFDIINIGGGTAISMAEIAEAIADAAGLSNQPISYLNPEKSNISYNVLDISRASQKTGYSPKVSLADGIRKTVSWWQTQEKIK